MPRNSLAHTLLSLFTNPPRATEIEGDLLEERAQRGHAWFAYHVTAVTLALFKESCKEAPLRLSLLTSLATGFIVLVCILLDRTFFAPDALLPAPFAGLLAAVGATFLSGGALSYFGPRLGTRTAACTTILLTTLIILKYAFADWGMSVVGYLMLTLAILPAPFLTGSILGHSLRSRS